MFSWIRHYRAEVRALPSALLVMLYPDLFGVLALSRAFTVSKKPKNNYVSPPPPNGAKLVAGRTK